LLAVAIIFLSFFGLASCDITTTRSYSSPYYDGYLSASASTFRDARNSYEGTVYQTFSFLIGGVYYVGSYYTVSRSAVFFDTSNIPDNAVIDSAFLSLYVNDAVISSDFNVTIQGTSNRPSYPLVSGDYWMGWYSDVLGSRSTDDGFSVDSYFNISLNSAGLGLISKTGLSRFLVRSQEDVDNVWGAASNYVSFSSREAGINYAPALSVTYTVPASGSGGSGEVGAYTYYVYGPFQDDGTVYNGTVHCKIQPSYNSSISFDLVGDGSTFQNFSYGFEQKAILMSWGIGDDANYTRSHYFKDDSVEYVYVFVPTDGTPFYLYGFNINDFEGVTNAYLESLVYLDGESQIVERQTANMINAIPFYMTWGQVYNMRLVCDQGVINFGTFLALAESETTLIIPYGSFPYVPEGTYVLAEALRVNGTAVSFSYADAEERTFVVYVDLSYLLSNGTRVSVFSDSAETNSYFAVWGDGDPDVSYRAIITAFRDGVNKTYPFNLNYVSGDLPNVWAGLSLLGSGLPVEVQYLPAIILIVGCLLVFSWWHISAGCWSAWFAAGVCYLLGWLPYDAIVTPVALGVTGVVCASITIGEWKKTERNI